MRIQSTTTAPRSVALILTLASLIASPRSHAELEVFFTRAEFEAAATQPLFTEDFEHFYSDLLLDRVPVTLLGGGARLSSESGRRTASRIDTPNTPPTVFGNGGITDVNFRENFVYSGINNNGEGILKIELPAIEGREFHLGFDYSGLGGPSPVPAMVFAASYRVTLGDGTVIIKVFPNNDGNAWPDIDGFIGFHHPDSPIRSVEILTFSDPIVPPGDPFYYAANIYAIDHLTTSLPDQDGDGLPDFYEDSNGLDKTQPDADSDLDGDGLSALEEFRRYTNPQETDSDSDGLGDGVEVAAGSDPTDRNDPKLYDLQVDFGDVASSGNYRSYDSSNQVAGGFLAHAYDAFASEITITPEFPDSESATVYRMVTRANLLVSDFLIWSNGFGDGPLARDFLAVDTQVANGGNGDYDGEAGAPTRMALRISGLPAGTYAWTSFHHDLDFYHTEFITEVSTDGGDTCVEIVRKRMTQSRSRDPDPIANQAAVRVGPAFELLPSTVDATFEADGDHDVIVRFTPLSADGPDTRVFGINGFHLIQTAAQVPPLAIIDIVFDPVGGMVTLTWTSAPGRFYAIDTSGDLAGWSELRDSIAAAETGLRTTLTFAPSDDSTPASLFLRVSEQNSGGMP